MTKVHIEFQRVQTFLFSVPRLRAMVGANTLLGEMLRVKLPELARNKDSGWVLLPVPMTDASQITDLDDPLKEMDNPESDAVTGILSRDGGHFEAVFASGAESFAESAASLLRTELPGLRFSVNVNGQPVIDRGSAVLSAELPVLARCEWTGRGLASAEARQGAERAQVASEVYRRHQAALRAEEGKADDLASRLMRKTALEGMKRPAEFEELAAGEYLAVIHADGNAVGEAAETHGKRSRSFFHRNRVLLRSALKSAIDRRCAACQDRVAPLTILMLGGDDVLVVCRASIALPFVVEFCAELERLQSDAKDPKDPFNLTMGVGVVISQVKVPFNRLHAVAEALASSAKRKFRSLDASHKASVVDWSVYTTAWAEDPAELRARDWVRGKGDDIRVLSRRPVLVLGTQLDSLEGLLKSAEKLGGAPRSQLRYLLDQLARGRTLADLAFAELSPDAANAVKNAGVNQAWIPSGLSGVHLTPLVDLIEVFEIPRLGRMRANSAVQAPYVINDGWEAVHE